MLCGTSPDDIYLPSKVPPEDKPKKENLLPTLRGDRCILYLRKGMIFDG